MIIGKAQAPGGICTNGICSYAGAPVAGDMSNTHAPWGYLGNTDKNYLIVGITGGAAPALTSAGGR